MSTRGRSPLARFLICACNSCPRLSHSLRAESRENVEQFLDFRARLSWIPAADCVENTVLDVLAQDVLFDPAQRCPRGSKLGEDIDAVAVVLDHLGDASDLTLDAAEACELAGVVGMLHGSIHIPGRGMCRAVPFGRAFKARGTGEGVRFPAGLRVAGAARIVLAVSILLTVFAIGALILVHEAGHLLAARAVGVPVAAFSVGIGPTVARRTMGGVEYRLGALPLGGYVMADLDSERDYLDLPVGRRVVFALGGPAMNVFVAFVLYVAAALASDPAGFPGALVAAWGATVHALEGAVRGFAVAVTEPHRLSGLVGAVSAGATWVEQGMARGFAFAALISANLAIFNLLPLPPLDGGRIVLCLLEKVHRSAGRLHVPLAVGGWVLVGGLFAYVTVLDIARLGTMAG